MYVSEARDTALLRRLQAAAAAAPGTHLANVFIDEPYNRTNFTLVGDSVHALAAAAVEVARAALTAVDLRRHAATHPRLGAVDHISCHPLPAAPAGSGSSAGSEQRQQRDQQEQQQAAALARSIAQQLGAGPLAVPVLTYGWAHPQQRRLDDVRRQLGYFRGAAAGSWAGALQAGGAAAAAGGAAAAADAAAGGGMPEGLLLPLAPCYGPPGAPTRSGMCCVGASPWIINYNVLLHTSDVAAARHVARAVSERGGGLAGVQAMALPHIDGIEVACNLLDPRRVSPAEVLAEVQRLAGAAGLEVGPAYRTNKAPEELTAAAAAAGL